MSGHHLNVEGQLVVHDVETAANPSISSRLHGRQASPPTLAGSAAASAPGKATYDVPRSAMIAVIEGLQMNGQSNFREEATLDTTSHAAVITPASLPPTSKTSQTIEHGISESSPGAKTAGPVLSEALSVPFGVNLPGSLDGVPGGGHSENDIDIRRWDPSGELPQGAKGPIRPQTAEMPSTIPESDDYTYEEQELDLMARSPDFVNEKLKDPGFTLLHLVAMLGHKTLQEALPGEMMNRFHFYACLARCLVSWRKAEVFVTDKYGCTPLQLAAAVGNTEMVRVLLEPYDLDGSCQEVLPQDAPGYLYLNHQDSQICFSALHGAVNHGQHDAVITLLQHGANPQALDVTRKTAFEVAPSLVSLQELLRLTVQQEDQVPRSVIVQLMAVVLDNQLKESSGAGASNGSSGAAAAGGAGAGGGAGGILRDTKSQRAFYAHLRWSKAARLASAGIQAPKEPFKRFSSAVIETIGNIHNADVGSTIRRHFGHMYQSKRYDVLVDYVILAINANHYKLTEMMIDRICNDCPDMLANSKWHETLEPLVSTFPTLFHRLLFKLQDMRDEDVRGFVRCLSPSTLQTSSEKRPHSVARLGSAAAVLVGLSQRGMSKAHRAVDRVKLLIYQQLVEGLRKVSYRIVKMFLEHSDQHLLNDMANFPIFAEFVGLVADMQTTKAIGESDSLRHALLELLHPSKMCTVANAVVTAAAFLNAGAAAVSAGRGIGGAGGGNDSCLPGSRPQSRPQTGGSAAPRPVDVPPVTLAWCSDTSRKVSARQPSAKVSFALSAQGDSAGIRASGCDGEKSGGGASAGDGSEAGRSSGSLINGGAAAVAEARVCSRSIAGPLVESRAGSVVSSKSISMCGTTAASELGDNGDGLEMNEVDSKRMLLSLQTLNVYPVLYAAVKAGKAYNVESAVLSIVKWVETNSQGDKAVFLAGITPDLVQELAMRFPSACASLLNLVSKDVLEQLDTLQVSANVLYGRDHLVKCSRVRNHFTWREQELRKLMWLNRGYSEHVVDALVDYGVPFECVYKAAVELGGNPGECVTPEQFAGLIEHGFTGPELKQLISNGIRLSKVIGYIEDCEKPPPDGVGPEFASQLDVPMSVLLRDMLRERLSPRIVDIILREEKMFETTKYNNFRPGRPLRKIFPEPLFVPQYTPHFVQMLLIMWQRGTKNAGGKVTMAPWSKDFIDTVFELNDPLCTKLKSAYDNKLTDTQVYIQGNIGAHDAPSDPEPSSWLRRRSRAVPEANDEDRAQLQHIRKLIRIFIGNYRWVHRWPVFLVAHVWVFVLSAVQTHWGRLEEFYKLKTARTFRLQISMAKKSRYGTIDAAVLAFPILVTPNGSDILTALVHADAPSAWFHFAIVRALYGLQWAHFGRVMVYLNAAVQLQFAACFLTFFLLILNYPVAESDDDGSARINRHPVIMGVLIVCVVLSASMLLERIQEFRVYQLRSWVSLGRQLELWCHAMVWSVALIVWSGREPSLIPALSGMAMLLFVARLTLFGLITEKLSTAVLALLEILSDSRYFFLLIALVYGGFVLAVAGLRQQQESSAMYTAQLFTVLLGDFQSSQLTSERSSWRFPDVSLVLFSIYAMLMLIVFMNLLIATMNDTYDRAKEFCEVEVMRLRSHMMVFVKHFMERSAQGKKLERLNGDVLHLLLRPEEIKSGRWLAQNTSEPSEYSAWAGRITYTRSTIVRDIEVLIKSQVDKAMDQMSAIEQRLENKVDAAAASAAAAVAAANATAAAVAPPPIAPSESVSGENLTALEQRLEEMQRGLERLLSRALSEAPMTSSP